MAAEVSQAAALPDTLIDVPPDWRRIESEIEGLRVESASPIGEGWNSSAFLVNRTQVFRFPKRADVWDEIEREIAFLRWSADRLPLKVPRYGRVERRSHGAPHGYAVYDYLPGGPLDLAVLSAASRGRAADQLAAFLRTLHDLTLPPNLQIAVPQDDERAAIAAFEERADREIGPRLRAAEARELSTQFDWYFADGRTGWDRTTIVHADLSRDHILAVGDVVSGILDFGDVNVGDRDYEFTYFFIDFGWAFVEDVARRYGHPDLDRLARKVRFFAIVDQIDTILNGASRAREGQVAEAWKRLNEYLR